MMDNYNQNNGITITPHSSLRNVEKNYKAEQATIRREQRINDAVENYGQQLNDLVNNLQLSECLHLAYAVYKFFSDLSLFVMNKNGDIYHADTSIDSLHPYNPMLKFGRNDVGNLLKMFASCNLQWPAYFEEKILMLVQPLFELLSMNKADPYIMLKIRDGKMTSIFECPDLFLFYDDNLFLTANYPDKPHTIEFIHGNNFHRILKALGNQPRFVKKDFEYIVNLMHCTNCIKKHGLVLKQLTKDILFQLEAKGMSFPFLKGLPQEPKPFSRIVRITGNECAEVKDINSFKKVWDENNALITNKVTDILEDLSAGNSQIIDQLARLVANINLQHFGEEKMWALVGNSSAIEMLLGELYWHQYDCFVVSPIQISKAMTISSLIQYGYYACFINHITSCTSIRRLDATYFSLLKKMIHRKPLKLKDRKYGKMQYINRATMVATISNAQELDIYSAYLGKDIEQINVVRASTVETKIELTDELRGWFNVFFTAYGLSLIFEKTANHKLDYDSKKVIREFVDSCCVVNEEVDCYNQDLYEAYVRYFKTRFAVQAVKRGPFLRILDVLYKVKSVRPRHKKTDNRRGLKGICVDNDKMQTYLAQCLATGDKTMLVREHVCQINRKAMELLDIQ